MRYSPSPDEHGNQAMELLLPDPPQPAIPVADPTARAQYAHIPRAYDMRLTSTTQDTYAKNLYAFQEQLLDDDEGSGGDDDNEQLSTNDFYRKRIHGAGPARISSKKKRTVTNETALQPKRKEVAEVKPEGAQRLALGSRSLITSEYREILRNRHKSSTTPKRSVQMMEESFAGLNNMLAAGVGKGHTKSRVSNLVHQKDANSNQPPEKFARMPRNELLDLLFTLFDRYKHWSLKRLREETQQPYVYLREVLLSIADQHQNGPYAGSWSLKREFSEARREQVAAPAPPPPKDDGADDMEDAV